MKMVLTNQNIVEAHEVTQINTAGQLTFTATIKSDVDEKIETTDIVFVKVKDDRYHPYKIVQSNMPTPNTVQYTCIEYAYYLFNKDGLVHDKRPTKLSVAETITQIIMGTKWKVGYTDPNLPTFTGNFYWQTRTDCFKELVEGTGAELEFYMTMANNKITSRTIEAYKQRGTDTHQRFTYGMNALEVIAEEDATNAVTKVYPRGSGEMYTSDGEGQRKLTISDVEWSKLKGDPVDKPLGQDYLIYGSSKYDLDNGNQPSSIVEFQDEKDANKLIRKAFNWLKQNNRPKVQFKAKVSDVGDLKLGDRVVIDREDLGIKYVTRVFKLDRNLLNEKLNTIELGDVVAHTLADAISNVSSSLADTNKRVDNVSNTIADGNGNTVTYGPNEPTTKKKGDTWYKPGDIVDGIQQYDVYVWDGEKWVLTIGNQLQNELLSKVEQAQKDTEEAKQQAQEASNKADAIENKFENDLINVRVDIDNVKHDTINALQKAEDAVLNANAAQQGVDTLKDRVDIYSTNIGNLFPNGNFSDTSMKEFNLIDGRYTTQGVTNSPQGSFSQLGAAYPTQNTNRNACVINNGKDVLEVKPEYSFNVNSGEEFYIQYDFYNDSPMLVEVGIIFNGGQKVAVRQNTTGLRNWHRIKGKVKAPNGAINGRGYISMNTNVSAYCFVSNVSISRVDASTSLIEVQDGKILETIQTNEQLNQRVQTAESTIESIGNMEGSNTLINTVKGQQQTIKDVQGNALEALETAKGTQTTIYNGGNLWMMPSFESGDLSKYCDISGSGSIVTNGAINTPTEEAKFNEPYKKQNPSTKALRINNTGECKQKAAYNQIAHAGETFNVSFDFYKDASGTGYVKLNGTSVSFGSGLGGGWYHLDTTITLPTNTSVNSVTPTVGSNGSTYVYFDNIVIQRADTGTEAQFSKLTQTADLIKGEVSSLDEKTKASLALLQDNINLKVDKDKVISQINLSPEEILIDGKKTHITNQTIIDNAVITSAMIKDISADKITTGTLNAANVKIVNLDVNDLVGNKTQFVQSAWNSVSSSININGDGIYSKRSDGSISAKYLSDGIQIWGNGKWLSSISYIEGDDTVFGAKNGTDLLIGYQGNSSPNSYYTSLKISGTDGNIDFKVPKVSFQGKQMQFGVMDWSTGAIPTFRSSSGEVNIGFGGETLWLGDAKGILTLNDIRNGKLDGLSYGGQNVRFSNIRYNNATYFAITSPSMQTGIMWGSSRLYFLLDGSVFPLADILRGAIWDI